MAVFINHYTVLGFSSNQKRSLVSTEEIKKAYRLKALQLHPDKRLDDPNAASAFQKLHASYNILVDDNARKAFDDSLIIREQQLRKQMKRKKMAALKEEAERKNRKMMAEFDEKYGGYQRSQEEIVRAKLLKHEVNEIRGMQANNRSTDYTCNDYVIRQLQKNVAGKSSSDDKEKMIRVYWEKVGRICNERTLRKTFEVFGDVKDVVVNRSFTNKGSAIVAMATREGADKAVTEAAFRKHSKHLRVMPFQ